jgi:hypothetical protein
MCPPRFPGCKEFPKSATQTEMADDRVDVEKRNIERDPVPNLEGDS